MGKSPDLTSLKTLRYKRHKHPPLKIKCDDVINANRINIQRYLNEKLNEKTVQESNPVSVMFSQATTKEPSLLEKSEHSCKTTESNIDCDYHPNATKSFQLFETPFGLWLLSSSNILHRFKAPDLSPLNMKQVDNQPLGPSDLYKTIMAGQHKSRHERIPMSQSLEIANKLSNSTWKAGIEQASLLELNREMLKVLEKRCTNHN